MFLLCKLVFSDNSFWRGDLITLVKPGKPLLNIKPDGLTSVFYMESILTYSGQRRTCDSYPARLYPDLLPCGHCPHKCTLQFYRLWMPGRYKIPILLQLPIHKNNWNQEPPDQILLAKSPQSHQHIVVEFFFVRRQAILWSFKALIATFFVIDPLPKLNGHRTQAELISDLFHKMVPEY